ncbi:MAG: hypothetical protein ACYDBX_01350, partial [Patescibacteria group bacterium]
MGEGISKGQMVDIVYGKLPVEDPIYEELASVGSSEVKHSEDELAYYYPRSIENVVRKDNYRVQGEIKLKPSDGKQCYGFQMLPDSRIVTSSWTTSNISVLSMWGEEVNGYEEQEIFGAGKRVDEFKMLPDSRIVTFCWPKPGILALSMWENKVNGYEEQEIFRTDKSVRNFQMLPDGSIVTSIRITSD